MRSASQRAEPSGKELTVAAGNSRVSFREKTEAIAARVRQQVESVNGSIRSEFQNIVKSAAVKALRGALENEVAALVLKLLVEYQVADIAGGPDQDRLNNGRDVHRSRLKHISPKHRVYRGEPVSPISPPSSVVFLSGWKHTSVTSGRVVQMLRCAEIWSNPCGWSIRSPPIKTRARWKSTLLLSWK